MVAKTVHILLLEDDANLRGIIAEYLTDKYFAVSVGASGQEGWEMLSQFSYDIVLVDTLMPQMSGLELLRILRDNGNDIPVVMLSDQNDKEDILRAYALGCDDYVAKPIVMDVLIAKINAVVRRCRITSHKAETRFQLGSLAFDSVKQQLGDTKLTSRENEVLLMLSQNVNTLVERSRILVSLWGKDTYFNSRSLSVYINHLRNMLRCDGRVQIINIHGKGYKLVIM